MLVPVKHPSCGGERVRDSAFINGSFLSKQTAALWCGTRGKVLSNTLVVGEGLWNSVAASRCIGVCFEPSLYSERPFLPGVSGRECSASKVHVLPLVKWGKKLMFCWCYLQGVALWAVTLERRSLTREQDPLGESLHDPKVPQSSSAWTRCHLWTRKQCSSSPWWQAFPHYPCASRTDSG